MGNKLSHLTRTRPSRRKDHDLPDPGSHSIVEPAAGPIVEAVGDASAGNILGGSLDHRSEESIHGDKELPPKVELEPGPVTTEPLAQPELPILPQQDAESSTSLALRTQAVERQARWCFTSADDDLDEAIALYEKAISTNPPKEDLAFLLANRAWCVAKRYGRTGLMDDLTLAQNLGEEALPLHPVDHPDRLRVLHNLVLALVTSYRRRHGFQELQRGILLCYEELDLQSKAPTCSTKVIKSLRGYLSYVTQPLQQDARHNADAIKIHQGFLIACPQLHPNHATALDMLGYAYLDRFNAMGAAEDITNAVQAHRRALELRSKGQPEYLMTLAALAGAIYLQYTQTKGLDDLLSAVELRREALCIGESLDDPDHRLASITTLGSLLFDLYLQNRDPAHLAESTQLQMDALKLTPPGHQGRPRTMTILASRLYSQYNRDSDKKLLSSAINYLREAIDIFPIHSVSRITPLASLSRYLSTRFRILGDEADQREAIEIRRRILGLQADNHARRYSLYQLSRLYTRRYNESRKEADLTEGIRLAMEAANVHQDYHDDRDIFLRHLAESLGDRFKITGSDEDLTQSIDYMRAALDIHTGSANDLSASASSLESLASLLWTRFRHKRNPADFVEAATIYRESMELPPRGRSGRHSLPYYLAVFLWESFREGRDMEDLGDATESALKPQTFSRIVLETVPAAELLHILDQCQRQDLLDFFRDVDDKIVALLEEASGPGSSHVQRLRAANYWRTFARSHHPESSMRAHMTALSLLDIVVSGTQSAEKRYTQLSTNRIIKNARGVASDAAAIAVSQGDLQLAVTLLEQGRMIIFTQIRRYRTPLDDLNALAPELANRFMKLSHDLDQWAVSRETSEGDALEAEFEDSVSRYQRVSSEWTTTLEEIRALEGWESFLKPTSFARLREAATKGPVIIVNISTCRSDAIIVHHTRDPILVPLPLATPAVVSSLANAFGPRPAEASETEALGILREIWRIIVYPVVEALRKGDSPLLFGSRIWWCPTGAASMLPLHAAGPYKRDQRDLPHMYISSYTPTLGTLIQARAQKNFGPELERPKPRLVVVGQSMTPGEKSLPSAQAEVEVLKNLDMTADLLEGSAGTREAVLAGISEHQWVHLVCHGHHNALQPFSSHFALHDGPVSLTDIIQRNLPRAKMAVLSACHSARTSESLPDEVLHPAAGMLFAGFKSVIGTMWALDDGVGPVFTEEFYKEMLSGKKGAKPCSQAAPALRKALEALGALGSEKVSLVQRINIVHFGI